MFVGVLNIELFIPQSSSLKSKRRVIKQLKDKLRANFNVSVSEIDAHEKWQRAIMGVACINADKKYINGTLSRIYDLITNFHRVEVIDSKMEIW